MELDDAKRLLDQMGLMGSSIYHVPLLSASEWEPSRGVGPPTNGGSNKTALLVVDALAKCTRKACDPGLLKGYQTSSYSGGIPILQYLLHHTLHGGGKEPLHIAWSVHRFLSPAD